MDAPSPSEHDPLALAMARWLDAAHAHTLQPGSGADALEEAQRLLAEHLASVTRRLRRGTGRAA